MFNSYYIFQSLERSLSQIPHVRPETPRSVTHNHDEDFSDDDVDENLVKNGDKQGYDMYTVVIFMTKHLLFV